MTELKEREITLTESDLKELIEAQQDYPELAH